MHQVSWRTPSIPYSLNNLCWLPVWGIYFRRESGKRTKDEDIRETAPGEEHGTQFMIMCGLDAGGAGKVTSVKRGFKLISIQTIFITHHQRVNLQIEGFSATFLQIPF